MCINLSTEITYYYIKGKVTEKVEIIFKFYYEW